MSRCIAMLGTLCILAGITPAQAESQFLAQKGLMKGLPAPAEDDEGPRQRIRPSGLLAALPRDATCAAIVSPFGSPTRYDGSRRPMDRFGGMHGGIDVTLVEGTPLLAIASGTVVHLGAGSIAEGNYLWLQHAPEHTQLPFWVYSKYQHLLEIPRLAVGDMVRVGQVVAKSGSTGTAGRHYGPNGYPHLHLTTVASPSGKYERQGSRIAAESAVIFDPVAIYVRALDNLNEIDRMADDRKIVPIPYLAEKSSIVPAGSLVVWPVGCKSR